MQAPTTLKYDGIHIPSLVGHLSAHFRLGLSQQLTLILGTGEEPNEQAALATWVRQELAQMATEEPVPNVVAELEPRLLTALQRLDYEQGAEIESPSRLSAAKPIPGPFLRTPELRGNACWHQPTHQCSSITNRSTR